MKIEILDKSYWPGMDDPIKHYWPIEDMSFYDRFIGKVFEGQKCPMNPTYFYVETSSGQCFPLDICKIIEE